MRKPSSAFLGISILLLALFAAGCNSSSPAISVSLSPSAAQTIDQGQSVNITASLTNDSSNKGVTWSLSGAGTLSSQTANSVIYGAPATVSTKQTAKVTATSAADTNATAVLSITVNPAPAITTTSLPSGIAGTSYSQSLTEAGGTAPFTWGVVAGQIPPGLNLNSSGGTISGTPTQAGTFNFTVELSDSVGLTTKAPLSITIAPAPALAVTTTSLANGALNTAYSVVLGASGGVPPYSWKLSSGSLPAGLGLSASGVISGTPTATGTTTIAVQVSDSQTPSPATATETLSLTINPVPFSIATTSLPNGTVGIGYSTTLQASGGVQPITWTVVSGSLPLWATLNATTGVIYGTPSATGTTSFTVRATDAETPVAATATQTLSITVTGTQNGLLSGQYAFSLGGYRGGLAGSLTADGNGNITAGTEDLENATTALSATGVAITSGTYAIGTDYRGTLTYTDANGNTFTFDLSLSPVSSAVATRGAIIETDATGNDFTGFLALQDPSAFSTSKVSGSYVFGLSGWDATGNVKALVGSATVANGSVTGGSLDENDGGTVTSDKSFTGTLSVSSSGRGTLTSSVAEANLTFYVVSSSEWMAIAASPSTGAVATGIIRQQSPEPYADSYISGTMVFASESATSTPAPQASLGLLTSPGDGTATFSFDVDAGGSLGAQTGSGTIDFPSGSGRFTLTLQTLQGQNDLVGYMVSTNTAFFIGTDSIPSFGTFQPRASASFTNSSLVGSFFFGSQPLVAAPSNSQLPVIASGVMSFDGNGNFSGTTDSKQGTTVTTSQLTGTYTVGSTGRVTLVPGTAILYVISSNKAAALYVGQAGYPNPFIQMFQQ